jgi:hypothetical protein
VLIPLEILTILGPPLLDLQIPAFNLVLPISLAYIVFLDHPQNFWEDPSSSLHHRCHEVAIHILLGLAINNIYTKNKNKSKKTMVSKNLD